LGNFYFLKKTVSILLLLVLVYNMMGYYFFVAIRQAEVKTEILQRKDSIPDQDLLVFEVPVTLYHQTNRGMETVSGDFEHDGRIYEMVRQKLENDTLYVYCYNSQNRKTPG
jgi:hypothetical protein